MRAARLTTPKPIAGRPLEVRELPAPEPGAGQVLLRVRACGVCRTDLHIVEGELPPVRPDIIPGHQIVGEIAGGGIPGRPPEKRGRVAWIGGRDGTCRYCRNGWENLCDAPTFTGYSVNGGYAEYALARADFVFALPRLLGGLGAGPLVGGGMLGFR